MKVKWLGWCFCLFMTSVVASPINKIVVFGDSLSDTGNLYTYMRQQLPMSPPYYQGRFSDGPVWIEHVVSHYFPVSPEQHFSNYAFGGSGVGGEGENDDDDFDDGAMLNLDAELDSYLLAHDGKANPSNLYVIWMGSNNYLSLPEQLDEEVSFTVSGIRRTLDRLVQKGAKHILVVGIPDLGKIPMAREFEYTKELSYVSGQHNHKVEAHVRALEAEHPEIQWAFYPVDVLLNNALDTPAQYGFKDVVNTCYDSQKYFPSSQSVLSVAALVHKSASTQMENCDGYLFFDPVHPSGRAHRYIAERGIELLDKSGFEFTG